MRTPILLLTLGLFAASSIGCEQEPKSPYDVTVEQRSTALGMPERIMRISNRVSEKETEAKTIVGNMPTAADKVVAPTDWEVVVEIIDAADLAGRDQAHGYQMRELQVVQDFYEDEKEEIHKKVGGAVDYAAKQKGCEPDAWGAVANGMNKAMEERLEERMKEINDAYMIIERNEEALGKKNVPELEKMVKDVTQASYTVHYLMPQAILELESMEKAAEDSKADIQRMVEEENAGPKGKSNPEMDKKREDRLKRAQGELVKADQAAEAAKTNRENLQQRTDELKKSYDEALTKLKDNVKAKKPA